MKIAAKIHIFFDIYKKSAILSQFLVIRCGSFAYLQKMLYLCKNFQTDMTATPNKKQPKTSKLSAWRKQIEESVKRTRTRTQARYDAFHRRQEAYSRISDELNLTLDEFFRRVESGDAACTDLWDDYLKHLAVGIHNIRMALDCPVVIGGVFLDLVDLLLELVQLLLQFLGTVAAIP